MNLYFSQLAIDLVIDLVMDLVMDLPMAPTGSWHGQPTWI
jgi:hypothetical protein